MATKIYTDNEFKRELVGANCIKFGISRRSRVISAPVETGQKSFDNKVLEPAEVRITAIVESFPEDPSFVISAINQMYANRKFEFYSVETDADAYKNLILKDCPYTIDQDRPDFMVYELVFVEAMLIQTSANNPFNGQDSNTKSAGKQQPSPSNRSGSIILIR